MHESSRNIQFLEITSTEDLQRHRQVCCALTSKSDAKDWHGWCRH